MIRKSKAKQFLTDMFPVEKVEKDMEYLMKLGLNTGQILSYAKKMQERWDAKIVKKAFIYFKKNKFEGVQFYDVKYVSLSRNISTEEAKKVINDYKNKKVTNLKGFIERHGEEKGRELFTEFQKTSKSSTDKIKDNLKLEYGDKWKEKWIDYQKGNSRRCKEFYLSRGLANTVEEAVKQVKDYQLKNSGVNVEYYLARGYKKEEIEDFISLINLKKRNHSRNRKYLKSIHGDKWQEVYENVHKKYRQNMEDSGTWIKLEDLDSWIKYQLRVWFLTEQSVINDAIKDIEKRSTFWHLDHIFSVKQGFLLDVEPEIIASPVNLRIISRSQNCSKQDRCDITLEKLCNEYKKWRENENKKNS